MKLRDVCERYHIGYRHNPKQFQDGTFDVVAEGGRLVLVALVKRKVRKNFRIVGVIKWEK